jgi:hypothetical protein
MRNAQTPAGLPARRLGGRIVALEPLAQEHLEGLWEAARDPRIWTWFPVPPAHDRAAFALPAGFEGVFRKHMLVREGENRDSAWYSVVDDDWQDVKRHLSARVAAAVRTIASAPGSAAANPARALES